MLLDIKPIPSVEKVIETITEVLQDINHNPHLAVHKLDTVETHIEDSLDLADLAFRLENTYNVRIENPQLRPLTRIEDLAESIHGLIVQRRQTDVQRDELR